MKYLALKYAISHPLAPLVVNIKIVIWCHQHDSVKRLREYLGIVALSRLFLALEMLTVGLELVLKEHRFPWI